MKHYALALTLLVTGLLTACSGGSTSGSLNDAGDATEAVDPAGKSIQHLLQSNVDGENIGFTVHEPDVLPEGETFPLILHSHGYGGSRQSSRPTSGLMARFLAAGYGILSLDERGHNTTARNSGNQIQGSGGTIRILDPALEGQDWLQVLDWAVANLGWLEFDGGNPVMGAIGGSYGGGYQHLIYALDPDRRLDAIAPDITWHDLRYSLNPGGNFKSQWASLLSGVGNQPGNTQDTEVNEGLVEGQANALSAAKMELLYRHSLASHCNGENDFTAGGRGAPLTRIDALYSQSPLDTLFNFNDLYHNYNCLNALGGDVRLMTKSYGHGLDNGDDGDNCGVNNRDDVTFAWFEEKLKGKSGAADFIPTICFNLGAEGTDGIVVTDITRGGTVLPTTGPISLIGKELNATASNTIDYVDLYTTPAGGDILAGIPTIDLDMQPNALNVGADPILYVGLGVREAGSSTDPGSPLMNQAMSFRQFGTFNDVELVGIFERLNPGDTVVLMLMSSYTPQFAGQGAANEIADITTTVSLPLIGVGHGAPNPGP